MSRLCRAELPSAGKTRQTPSMKDAARTAVGISLITGVLLGLSGNAVIAILLLLIGAFIVIWGQTPTATESYISRLPGGDKILKGLGHLAPIISTPPRDTPPELVDLSHASDWAVHNLLNRNPVPTTPADIDQWEKDFRAWEKDVSVRLANRELFTHSEKSRFDTLGFVEPIMVYGDARLDPLLSQLNAKLERLNEAIQGAQRRLAQP